VYFNPIKQIKIKKAIMSSSLPSIQSSSNQKVDTSDPGYKYDPMDPTPGQIYVEFSKDGNDGNSKVKGVNCGLNVEKRGKYIYLCKVEYPAPKTLHLGDRVIAINGKKGSFVVPIFCCCWLFKCTVSLSLLLLRRFPSFILSRTRTILNSVSLSLYLHLLVS